jgi:hypothetical protein
MPINIGLVTRLLATEGSRAQRVASTLQVAIQPRGMVISAIAMAGEHTTIHGLACSRIGQSAEFQFVPDPRRRDDQYELFEWLGSRIENYFQECREAKTYPQIWVSSGAAQGHLDVLADRLRYNRDNSRVKRFGELLSYATERYPMAGQQALHTATGALRLHWATGQQEGEDEHLLTLLTWINPPRGKNIYDAVAEAELVPMGCKTDPIVDRDVLDPLLKSYNTARRRGVSEVNLAARTRVIKGELRPIVMRIHDAIQEAITVLRTMKLPRLPDLDSIEERERQEFLSFMDSRDRGYRLPLRDRPKLAAFRLSEREDAVENLEAAVRIRDTVARAEARLSGHIVVGQVINPQRVQIGSRRFESRFELVTTQLLRRVRPRDELYWIERLSTS